MLCSVGPLRVSFVSQMHLLRSIFDVAHAIPMPTRPDLGTEGDIWSRWFDPSPVLPKSVWRRIAAR